MSPPDVPPSFHQRIREAARDRCGYCLSSQQYVMGKLEVEHVTPRARGGSGEESNLWLSCSLCNRYKGSQITGVDSLSGVTVELFNPRTQVWGEHFRWSPDGTRILGVTPIGRVTVEVLRLNNDLAVEVRRQLGTSWLASTSGMMRQPSLYYSRAFRRARKLSLIGVPTNANSSRS